MPQLFGEHPIFAAATLRWVDVDDGVRLRYAEFHPTTEPKGTVHIFNGRTEYIEKYSDVIARFVEMGYCVTCHDWRGQGASTRAESVSSRGHVIDFDEYQRDARAIIDAATHLPHPRYLFCHSMGGAIGTRYLMGEHNIQAAIYSAPMWKIHLPKVLEFVAPHILRFYRKRDELEKVALGTRDETYESYSPFKGNFLTTDADEYAKMASFSRDYPEIGTGGPTYQWMHAARAETDDLAGNPLPKVKSLVFVGDRESVVDRQIILDRVADAPDYQLVEFSGAKHEVYVEKPATRQAMWLAIMGFLDS